MKLPSGLEILENEEGFGPEAKTGDTVVYNVRIFLNRGDEVPINEASVDRGIPDELIRRESGHIFVDHVSTLGKRHAIAGIEKALIGMRAGGFRKLRVGPHLAYRDRGVPGLIPPDAVLNINVWLREIR
ncbi:MAG: FKBP-type peptidyl-prolyl cis-trans isomerase [Alphaproteobacteria bacterium]|nr:FKBP-type peptidyl-prolyl cis-trans isomerase [Alphaproteobacteria bacterium]